MKTSTQYQTASRVSRTPPPRVPPPYWALLAALYFLQGSFCAPPGPAGAAGLIPLADPGGAWQALISPEHGGELASFRVRYQGAWVETLYRAADYSATTSGWTGRAPWLWPATGRNEPLPQHGFARDLPWKVAGQPEPARVTLTLEDSAETRRLFPHRFRLSAEYSAEPGGVFAIRFTVTASAKNTAPLPFSAGNHITFRTPLVPGSDPLAMTLTSPSTVEYLKKDRIPTGATRPRSLSSPVPVRTLGKNEAVSLGGYRGDPWLELHDPAGLTLRLWHHASSVPPPPLVQFNLWGDPAAGYFSPEPWVGLQNAHNSRQGLTSLPPGARWDWVLRIRSSTN